MKMDTQHSQIITIARDWIGTPYHHQASKKGVGCDCLGLVRGVWRQLYGNEIAVTPPYSRDWGEADNSEPLLTAAQKFLCPAPKQEVKPGDVLLFRMHPHSAAKHLGIMTGQRKMVHAMEGVAVSEVFLGSWWLRRRAGAFAFPTKPEKL